MKIKLEAIIEIDEKDFEESFKLSDEEEGEESAMEVLKCEFQDAMNDIFNQVGNVEKIIVEEIKE